MRKTIWVSIVALLALACISQVHAADVTITCVAPTKNTDGSALTNLQGFNFYGGVSGRLLGSTTAATGCKWVEKNSNPGLHQYFITAVNTAAVESDPTATVSVDVPQPAPLDTDGDGVPDTTDQCPTVKGVPPTGCPLKPNPPTAVQGQITAYEYNAAKGTMAVVGIAWPGTQCNDETKKIGTKTYHSIAAGPASVDYIAGSSTAKQLPLKVWAVCDALPTASLEAPPLIRAEAPGILVEVTG